MLCWAVIALVTFAGFPDRLGFLPLVGGEWSANVDALLELALFITADVALIGSGIDQFSLGHLSSPLVAMQEQLARARKDASNPEAWFESLGCSEKLNQAIENDSFFESELSRGWRSWIA
jgi:hypothetical protein